MIQVVKFKSDLVSKMETFMLGFELIHKTGKFPQSERWQTYLPATVNPALNFV